MRRFMFLLAGVLVAAAPVRAQDLPESSPEALMHHAKGVELYVKNQYAEAVQHFEKAFAADPTFYVALLMAGITQTNAGNPAASDSLYAIVDANRHRLSGYYQARLDAQRAALAGDVARAADLMAAAAEKYPGTKAAYNHALWAAGLNRHRAVLTSLRTLDGAREPMRGWYGYVSVYANAAHALGEYEDELAHAVKSRAGYPGDIRPLGIQAEALAALGRVKELDRVLDEVAGMAPTAGVNPGNIMMNAGLELTAHGHAAAAKPVLERALAWFNAQPASQFRQGRATTLYALGRHREALAIWQQAASEAPDNFGVKVSVAIGAAKNGDRRPGTALMQRLEAGEFELAPAPRLSVRAVLAAALGERDKALALLQESGVRGRGLHRDPVWAPLAGLPAFQAYLKSAD